MYGTVSLNMVRDHGMPKRLQLLRDSVFGAE